MDKSGIKMESRDAVAKSKTPAAFYVANAGNYFCFNCPCGCGDYACVPINVDRGWTWNGSVDYPTLRPSLHNLQCGWHGFLTDGVFKSV